MEKLESPHVSKFKSHNWDDLMMPGELDVFDWMKKRSPESKSLHLISNDHLSAHFSIGLVDPVAQI